MEELDGVIIGDGERVDDLQRNGFRIIQNERAFCFGIDAVLLSAFVKAKKSDQILDMCTGNGIIPILLAARTEAQKIYGLEIQSLAVELAKRSLRLNDIEGRVEIVEGDIRSVDSYFEKGSMDTVTCNPPYMVEKHGILNDTDSVTIARHEILCNLEDVISAAAMMLKTGGNFYMVHRPFRLSEIMVLLSRYKLEPKRIRFVHPFVDKEPNMVLIEAKKGAKPNVIIEKPLVVYESTGEYTQEVLRLYGKIE